MLREMVCILLLSGEQKRDFSMSFQNLELCQPVLDMTAMRLDFIFQLFFYLNAFLSRQSRR